MVLLVPLAVLVVVVTQFSSLFIQSSDQGRLTTTEKASPVHKLTLDRSVQPNRLHWEANKKDVVFSVPDDMHIVPVVDFQLTLKSNQKVYDNAEPNLRRPPGSACYTFTVKPIVGVEEAVEGARGFGEEVDTAATIGDISVTTFRNATAASISGDGLYRVIIHEKDRYGTRYEVQSWPAVDRTIPDCSLPERYNPLSDLEQVASSFTFPM